MVVAGVLVLVSVELVLEGALVVVSVELVLVLVGVLVVVEPRIDQDEPKAIGIA